MKPEASWRSPRLRFPNTTPAVLRFQNGQRIRGKLQVVSLTGGLLYLSDPLNQGSRVKLMFLTDTGAVLGTAEMLTPVSGTLQPFRFIAIDEGDQRKLGEVIRASAEQDRREHQLIVKHRAW